MVRISFKDLRFAPIRGWGAVEEVQNI